MTGPNTDSLLITLDSDKKLLRENNNFIFSSKKYLVIEKKYLGNTLNHDELITAIGKALKSGHEKVNLNG